jgi:hypothetical protein
MTGDGDGTLGDGDGEGAVPLPVTLLLAAKRYSELARAPPQVPVGLMAGLEQVLSQFSARPNFRASVSLLPAGRNSHMHASYNNNNTIRLTWL